jgi:hypothetical protein
MTSYSRERSALSGRPPRRMKNAGASVMPGASDRLRQDHNGGHRRVRLWLGREMESRKTASARDGETKRPAGFGELRVR